MPIKNFEINKDKIYYLNCTLKQFREKVLQSIIIEKYKIFFLMENIFLMISCQSLENICAVMILIMILFL